MTNYAVIVGINAYPQVANQTDLFGAVSDAADFAEWALHQNGGNVASDDLFFWTSSKPTAANTGPLLGEYLKTPTPWLNGDVQVDFNRSPRLFEITNTAAYAGRTARTRRLENGEPATIFVFLAGHGVLGKTRNDDEWQTCFLAGDYQKAVGVQGLIPLTDFRVELLKAGFGEAHLFMDCCRTKPTKATDLVATLALPQAPMPDAYKWTMAMAAQQNEAAWETPHGNPTRGAFSKALVRGLRQVRNSVTGALTVSALKGYVANAIIGLAAPNKQSPHFASLPDDSEIVLACGPRIPLPVTEVAFTFPTLAAGTQVRLLDDGDNVITTFVTNGEELAWELPVGRMYVLETEDGTQEFGFLNQGKEGLVVEF